MIISSGKESSFITGLPQGNKSENYVVKLQVLILDSLDDAYAVQVVVQVKLLTAIKLIKYRCLLYNKHLLDEVEHDIMNYQNQGLCYLPQPSASADNTVLGFDNS